MGIAKEKKEGSFLQGGSPAPPPARPSLLGANGYYGPSEISHQKNGPNDKAISATDREALLDCLHGAVPDKELAGAVKWEYSRRDQRSLCAAVEYRNEIKAGPAIKKKARLSRSARNELQQTMTRIGFVGHLPSFPQSNWRDLSSGDKEFVLALHPPSMGPISVLSYQSAVDLGVPDWITERAADSAQRNRPAVMKGFGSNVYPLIKIDAGESRDIVSKRFQIWMNQPEQAEIFEEHHRPNCGRGLGNDRLKRALYDLAIWRLDVWMGFKEARKWTATNRRKGRVWVESVRGKGGGYKEQPMVFYGHGKNTGAVCPDRREWDKAVTRAKDFLCAEFGEQLFPFVSAVTRDTPSSPHFFHLGSRPMQIEGFAVAVIRRLNDKEALLQDPAPVEVVPRGQGIGPEEHVFVGEYNGRLYQFEGGEPESRAIRCLGLVG